MLTQTGFLVSDSDEIKVNGVTLRTFDLGGQQAGIEVWAEFGFLSAHSLTFPSRAIGCPARKLWKDFMVDISGIIFVQDSSDEARFEEACKELQVRATQAAHTVLCTNTLLLCESSSPGNSFKRKHSTCAGSGAWEQD